MMEEIWRPVIGHEGAYEVSDRGRVRSLDRMSTYRRFDHWTGRTITVRRRKRGQVLLPNLSSTQHTPTVKLEGTTAVRLLVLRAFRGEPAPHQEAGHVNNDSMDVSLNNLVWRTRSQRLEANHSDGLKRHGEKHHLAKYTAAEINAYRETRATSNRSQAAKKHGMPYRTAFAIDKGESWRFTP